MPHGAHGVVPSTEKVPVEIMRFRLVLSLPGAHPMQSPIPAAVPNLPAGQGKQAEELPVEKVPATQRTQLEAPAAAYEPISSLDLNTPLISYRADMQYSCFFH